MRRQTSFLLLLMLVGSTATAQPLHGAMAVSDKYTVTLERDGYHLNGVQAGDTVQFAPAFEGNIYACLVGVDDGFTPFSIPMVITEPGDSSLQLVLLFSGGSLPDYRKRDPRRMKMPLNAQQVLYTENAIGFLRRYDEKPVPVIIHIEITP